jgi:hypothetical protein
VLAFQKELHVGVHSEVGFQCAGSVFGVVYSPVFRCPS